MEYTIKPEEHELREARQIIEKTLESIRYTLEKDEDLKINLGYAEKDKTGEYGVTGKAISPSNAEIYFNTSTSDWKENLEHLVTDIYGQTWFYDKSEINFAWQQLLASITGLITIEKTKEAKEIEKQDFKEEWAEKKTQLSEEYQGQRTNLSWQLKTLIGRKLLENNTLEELPNLKRSEVLEAGNQIFN